MSTEWEFSEKEGGGVFSSIVALSLCCSPIHLVFFSYFFSGKIINILKAKVISSDI